MWFGSIFILPTESWDPIADDLFDEPITILKSIEFKLDFSVFKSTEVSYCV